MKLPPLPDLYLRDDEALFLTGQELRRLQADAARAALEEAAKVCDAAAKETWAVYRGQSPSDNSRRGEGQDYIGGASDQSRLLAAAIRKIEVKHD